MKNWTPVILLPATALIMPVHAADFMSAEAAQRLLFANASTFEQQHISLSHEQKDQIKSMAGVTPRSDELAVWKALDGATPVGWFFIDNVIGKHEFITYALAIDMAGKVLGVEILSYRETHGGQIRNPAWRLHFNGKILADKFKLNQDIPNISGATLSCRNVTDGVKRLLATHKLLLSS